MKFISRLFITICIILGICSPAFASRPARQHPVYMNDLNTIQNLSCKAIAMIPYSGDVLYSCPDGNQFWSDVLVPTSDSPLFMYFKNRKQVRDDDATDTAVNTAVINSVIFN